LAVEQPALCFLGARRLTALPCGPGAANALFRARTVGGPVVIKIRRDPLDDGSREAWALRRTGDLGPSLLAHTTAADLRERATDPRAREPLGPELGGVLVLSLLEGRAPSPDKLGEDDLERAGRLIARLHRRPLGRTPRAPSVSSAPAALNASALELLDVLKVAPDVDPALVGALARRWRVVRRDLPSARVRRALCHGDLRWHNVIDTPQGLMLFDFEHAGVGDAALDLALFSARTPLTCHQELAVLDAYLDEAGASGSLIDRFLALKPAAEHLGALAGAVDVVDVLSGQRPVIGDPAAVVSAKLPSVELALASAIGEQVSLLGGRRRRSRRRR
jgi:hypothetical protein